MITRILPLIAISFLGCRDVAAPPGDEELDHL